MFSHAVAIRNAGLEPSEGLFTHVCLLRIEQEIGIDAVARDPWASLCVCMESFLFIVFFSVQFAG